MAGDIHYCGIYIKIRVLVRMVEPVPYYPGNRGLLRSDIGFFFNKRRNINNSSYRKALFLRQFQHGVGVFIGKIVEHFINGAYRALIDIELISVGEKIAFQAVFHHGNILKEIMRKIIGICRFNEIPFAADPALFQKLSYLLYCITFRYGDSNSGCRGISPFKFAYDLTIVHIARYIKFTCAELFSEQYSLNAHLKSIMPSFLSIEATSPTLWPSVRLTVTMASSCTRPNISFATEIAIVESNSDTPSIKSI